MSPEAELWQAVRAAYGDQMVTAPAALAGVPVGEPRATLPDEVAERLEEMTRRDTPVDVVNALTERFMDSARRAGSDQVTPARVVRAVRHFAPDLPDDATVFDPACGIGMLLLSVAPGTATRRRGREVDPDSARFAQLRADLMGRSDVRVLAADSLRADQWQGLGADLVVCDPPAGVTEWGREELLLDARWELGTPSKAEGELAWLQHAYAHARPGGHVLMVMPASVAYRGAGRRIRAEPVRRGIVRQVVALPPGTATSRARPVHLWCLRRPGPGEGAHTVLTVRLIDLTDNGPDDLPEPRPEQIVDVPLVELLDDTVDPTPGNHLEARHRDYPGEYVALREELEEEIRRLAAPLPGLVPGGGTGSLDGATTGVADLIRAGPVEYQGGLPVSTSDRLDTDYLRGFLRSAANTRRSTGASGTHRLDVRGTRIPRMGIAGQRRYGSAFRALSEFEEGMRRVDELSRRLAEVVRDGLTAGAPAPEE
ncbi:hypothetical protein GCM10027160_10350 [Streptomyces calidiresistens]